MPLTRNLRYRCGFDLSPHAGRGEEQSSAKSLSRNAKKSSRLRLPTTQTGAILAPTKEGRKQATKNREDTMTRLNRRPFVAAAAGAITAPYLSRNAHADDAIKMRCSLDTAPSHPRNQAVVDYVAKIEEASQGKIKGEVFHSGQLFADLNVSKALIQGQVDMAAPGTWTMTGLVPDGDFSQLPILYGQPTEFIRRCVDGAA